MILINIFFAWWMWSVASDHFEKGNNTLGWVGIALSAANAATALAHLV